MPKLAGWFTAFIFGFILRNSDTLTLAGHILSYILIFGCGGVFFVTWGFIIYRQIIKPRKKDESTESDNRSE